MDYSLMKTIFYNDLYHGGSPLYIYIYFMMVSLNGGSPIVTMVVQCVSRLVYGPITWMIWEWGLEDDVRYLHTLALRVSMQL